MSTTEILNNLAKKRHEFDSIKLHFDSFGPFFSITSAILNTKSLVREGIDPSISELLLPHLITSFGSSLLTNTLFPRFVLSKKDLALYFTGFILSLFVHSSDFIMFFLNELPHFSKFFSLVKLKNSPEDTFKILSWVITNKIIGICLNKLVLKKKLKIKMEELFSIIFTYTGIGLLKMYNMNDYYVIIFANIVPLSSKAVECLRERVSRRKKSSKRPEKKLEKNPEKKLEKNSEKKLEKKLEKSQEDNKAKTPRRKASVASKIEKST
ncbi:hypothetical protein GINT2_000700 [Glugoides intestinalis]